jgi:hypothetical protein
VSIAALRAHEASAGRHAGYRQKETWSRPLREGPFGVGEEQSEVYLLDAAGSDAYFERAPTLLQNGINRG